MEPALAGAEHHEGADVVFGVTLREVVEDPRAVAVHALAGKGMLEADLLSEHTNGEADALHREPALAERREHHGFGQTDEWDAGTPMRPGKRSHDRVLRDGGPIREAAFVALRPGPEGVGGHREVPCRLRKGVQRLGEAGVRLRLTRRRDCHRQNVPPQSKPLTWYRVVITLDRRQGKRR